MALTSFTDVEKICTRIVYVLVPVDVQEGGVSVRGTSTAKVQQRASFNLFLGGLKRFQNNSTDTTFYFKNDPFVFAKHSS